MPPTLRWHQCAARLFGWTAALGSLGFLATTLWHQTPWARLGAHADTLLPAIVLGAGTYGLAGILLADAWRLLLGAPWAARLPHYRAYGRSQIAKYLPGNFGHLVGRQILGRHLGHSQRRLVVASLAESGLLVVAAAGLGLPVVQAMLPVSGHLWLIGPPALGLALGAVLLWRRPDWWYSLWRLRAPLAAALVRYLVFFLICGGLVWVLARTLQVADGAPPSLLLCLGAWAGAWIVGFLTPGLSAGIGVREAGLLLLLGPELAGDAVVLVAIAMRLVTTCGDVLLLVLSTVTMVPQCNHRTRLDIDCIHD